MLKTMINQKAKTKNQKHKHINIKSYIFFICIFNFWYLIFNSSASLWAVEPSLSKLDRNEINKALQAQGITEKELGFEKKWATDSFYRLKIVTDIMDEPLKMPDYLDKSIQLVDSLKDKIVPELVYLSKQLDIKINNNDVSALNQEISTETKKLGQPHDITDVIIACYKVSDRYLKQAIKNLDKDEITTLLIEAPVLWSDEENTLSGLKGALHREFGIAVDTSRKIEIDTILELLKKIDRRALALSGLSVAIGVDKILKELEKLAVSSMVKTSVPQIKGSVYLYKETEWGKFVIGSEEGNVYDGDFALIIDLGSNDTYKGRTGGAVGILSNPFSVAIDLNGDDLYDAPKTLFNFGTGLFGCGMLIDMKGNDTYKGYHNSLGAGLFGTGVILDYEGDDIYSASCFSEGAGNFGIGILTDIKGNDTYRGFENCQAFSSTWGYGLLADFEGNDLYYAGGKYLHKPLLPDDYRTLSQGFSIGFRPVASGGIGLLYDKRGQDFYNGGAFAQGCSYWYSLGMLYDGEGNDFYNATEYAQGAGIHLSNGILVDRSGDDHYFSRLGPAQGEGHDFAVGILIDKKGNDSYLTSGGQGIGLTNSFGLFIDCEGNDAYTTIEKSFGQGMANWSRGFGGIGLFLDLQGKDIYPKESPAENTSNWTQTVFGSGVDIKGIEKEVEVEKEEEPDTIKLKTAPIADVFKEAALWEVGSATKRVKAGRTELLHRSEEAINYICNNKMNSKDGLELRAIEELAKALPDSIKPKLYKALYDKDRWTRANGAYLLGKIKAKDAIDSLLIAMKEKRVRARGVIGAFEDIGDSTVVPIVITYLKDKEEPTRIASARALAKIKDSRAISELYNALHDKFFTVRIAAETALVAIGDLSLKYLLTKTQDPKIIGILAMLGATLDTIDKRKERIEIQKIIISYLDNNDTSLRLKAVSALGLFNEPSLKLLLQSKMALETDEFVLNKYKEILKE